MEKIFKSKKVKTDVIEDYILSRYKGNPLNLTEDEVFGYYASFAKKGCKIRQKKKINR